MMGRITVTELNSGKKLFLAEVYGFDKYKCRRFFRACADETIVLETIVLITLFWAIIPMGITASFVKECVYNSSSDVDFSEEVHLQKCKDAIDDFFTERTEQEKKRTSNNIKSVNKIKYP